MAFHVRITFSGICVVVPNSHPDAKVRMCIALPDGRGELKDGKIKVRKALDGSQLRRHQAFVLFKVRDLLGSETVRSRARGMFTLDDNRLTMEIAGEANPFKEELPDIAHLGKITKNFGDVDPKAVSEKASGLVAQVLIDKGAVSQKYPDWNWTFPNTLSHEEPGSKSLTSELSLYFKDLTKFSLWVKPFTGELEEEWQFKAPGDKTVDITVANLCDDNPLRWTALDKYLPPDEDFKWHYEILAARETLKTALHYLPLPIPHPVSAVGNGQGVNCIPARTNKASYDKLDQFLP